MKTPPARSESFLAGACLTLALALGWEARGRPDADGPPELELGTEVFGLEASRPLNVLFPSVGPTQALTVKAVSGPWVLVDVPGQPRGPIWFNFDQVIHYRTKL